VALLLSLFISATDFFHRLLANGTGLNLITIWWKATLRLRFRIFNESFLNLFMKSLNDYPFLLDMTSMSEVIWCNRLVANWVLNFPTKVSKQLIEKAESGMNQVNAYPQRCGKNTAKYHVVWSVVHRYWSSNYMILIWSSTFIILS